MASSRRASISPITGRGPRSLASTSPCSDPLIRPPVKSTCSGVSNVAVEIGAKQLELLHELVPAATLIALLVNPATPVLADTLSRGLQTAARAIRQQILVISASTERDLDMAFTTI